MKQDGNWVPTELVFPILALEYHVDFITIKNDIESTLAKNYSSELINKHKVLCNWDIKYVLLLCANPDVELCSQMNEENSPHHMLSKKETKSKSINVLNKIK